MDHTTTTPPPAPKPDPTPPGQTGSPVTPPPTTTKPEADQKSQTGSPVTTPPPPAKPVASKTAKAASGKSAAKSSASGEMPPLINPAWAAAVVKKHDITGKTAERAVIALTTAIEKQVAKATKSEKLEKLVLAAIAESYRDARK